MEARGLRGARLHDAVRVGELGLVGEIVRLRSDAAWIQVFEDTAGLAAGDPVECLGHPLHLELGPGLLGGIFDGIGRPLTRLEGAWIARGARAATLDRARRWAFRPTCVEGQRVSSGDVLGTVEETRSVTHRVMAPPGVAGTLKAVASGELGVDDVVAWLDDGTEVRMQQTWPVRVPRPARGRRHDPVPFLTGQRVLDFLFPLQCGGCAVVPGGFGTGKTVVEQTLARHAEADVVIFVGCGERGNEITEVLDELPRLSDPRGGLLMDRSILVVNTSNMPVAAREASVYTGMTLAEYYRDMGCSVALLVDSTSRWAEALREIASRLEEMPGEEGYPTYLGTRLAQLYERAGRVACLGSPERVGSVTMVAAVSPPGGDLSEPVTQCSVRVGGALWALDPRLAHRRHYPAVDWTVSFSVYTRALDPWFEAQVSPEWPALRRRLVDLLHAEAALEEAVALVGIDAMADGDRAALESARLMREAFLRQNVFLPTDATCPPRRQLAMAAALLRYADGCQAALRRGVPLAEVLAHPARSRLAHMTECTDEDLDALGDPFAEEGAPC